MREYGIWKEVLSAINADNDLDKGNIVERIKEKLSLESLKEYCEWKDTNFDVGHLFKVTDGNNIDDHTLFNLAIKSNCTNVVNVLISIGPDINKVYQHTWTPLLLAIESGNVEILRVLIDKGKTIGKVFKYTKPPLLILAIIDHHLAPNRRNLSNQEETPQFKFLVVFKYSCIGSASAVITEIFTGAISARRLAWFWEERSNH
ncbi:ankyrin repeat domain-containing protein [Wolbachia endosymbiont (group A) of Myopa testacea]|uniref:ankyrin repeat domain-containing protein n=1 Tax=Wolbachia endosymbiont (group A) of Myopa testacea TaxID=3066148 RepID=UPI00333F8D1F